MLSIIAKSVQIAITHVVNQKTIPIVNWQIIGFRYLIAKYGINIVITILNL